MTNEEAIEILENDIEICTIQQKEACDMAIKALESEDPRRCENCLHFILRDSAGVVLCGSDARECDFTPKEG